MTSLAATALALAAALAPPAGGDHDYRGSSGGTDLTLVGSSAWAARSVEATLRPLSAAAGSMGLVLHYVDDANHYLFLYSTNSDALMIYRKSGGYTLLGSVPFTTPLGEEHVLRGEDDGAGNLSLYWDGVHRLTVLDTTYDSGRAGLRVWNATADFDDVHVKDSGGGTLLFDDFDDGNANGWSGGAAWSVVQAGGGGGSMPPPTIDTSFEGGNVEVVLVDPQSWTLYLQPELKGSSPYRAWFYFELSSTSSAQPTRFVFQNASFFNRPVYSYDDVTWTEFPAPVGGTYALTLTQDPVWIAHSIPYLAAHEQQLIADVQGPYMQPSQLSTSEGGRAVTALRITDPGGLPEKYGIWLVGRNHAWEASGSWVADGFVRWLVSSDPQATRLRLKSVVHVVPILDVDNVALGGSGKDQQPIDFNRDWRSAPHWNAVRDAIAAIDAGAQAGSYDLFLDSHCPGSASTFLAVQPQSMVPATYWQSFQSFRQLLMSTTAGGALPYGGSVSEWGPAYHPLWNQMSFWHQYAAYPDELSLSLTLETQTTSHQGYRDYAAGLGRAIDLFFDCPAPVTRYCTAGTSAAGCRAALSACGEPSATAAGGFHLIAAGVEGDKDGLFFFGTNGPQANPWGNGSSFQCVIPPVRRAGLLVGSGLSGACDGSFSQDLNALWCPSCPGPAKNPGAGATVQAQLWYRDPLNTSNRTTSLSDALQFAVGP